MTFRYELYGMKVESSRRIALLTEVRFDTPDIMVAWASREEDAPAWERVLNEDLSKRRSLAMYAAPDGRLKVEFANPAGNLCYIVDRARSVMTVVHDIAAQDVESYFVGPFMGGMLRLRGVTVLHASVVEIAGRAIALCGEKRSGKSTHAAAFAQRGCRVLADDMAAITFHDGRFMVHAGYDRIRLREGARQMVHADGALQAVYSFGDSVYSPLESGFHGSALPLDAVYLLTPDDTAQHPISRLNAAEAMALLGKNTFANYMVTPGQRRGEFEDLFRLAGNVPVRRLHIKYDMARLAGQCDAILADMRGLA